MEYNSKKNTAARTPNSSDKSVGVDDNNQDRIEPASNKTSSPSVVNTSPGTSHGLTDNTVSASKKTLPKSGAASISSGITVGHFPGSSRNSVVIRWFSSSSSDENDALLNVHALISMQRKLNERQRIKKLGSMVPLAQTLGLKSSTVTLSCSLPALSSSDDMRVNQKISSLSDTLMAIPMRRKMGQRQILTEVNRIVKTSTTDSDGGGRKSSLSSPFKRKARKSLSFGFVETQIEEAFYDDDNDEEEPTANDQASDDEAVPENDDPEITSLYRAEFLS